MRKHVSRTCCSGMFFSHLRRLRSVRRQLGRDVSVRLMVYSYALVLSSLDYCNAVLVGLPATTPHGTTACGGKTHARPETTRPCNFRPSGVALASYCATNKLRVQIVSPRAQGPDWSGSGLHHQPAHAAWSPTFRHTLHCAPPATATSSNQELSGELVTVHSLSPHLVHGIAYRQN